MYSEHDARSLLMKFEMRTLAGDCKKNFTKLTSRQEEALVASLVDHYYLAKGKADPRTSSNLAVDFEDAVYGTVIRNRASVVPWLNSLRPLAGMRILEIGSGAGGSVVPLAEQGAYVVGIDIDRESLAVAKDRLRLHGLAMRGEFHVLNAIDLRSAFRGETFDAVIFFASLEHMAIDERLRALPAAWSMLGKGGRLAVIETPNRLWWYDGHTSELPFYNWLPDPLAYHYRTHSRRKDLKDLPVGEENNWLTLTRLGRGASYHEFQVALPDIDLARVDSSMRSWLRRRNPLRWMAWHASGSAAFSRFLHRAAPGLPQAFFEPYLDFTLAKV